MGPRRFFDWQVEWWLFLDFMSAAKHSWLHEGIYAQTASSGCSRLGTRSVTGCARDVAQARSLEAKAVGEASTVKVEAVVCTTLTARSELYNGAVLHAAD